jgi:DNA-binding NarL/FixJ family response regulator
MKPIRVLISDDHALFRAGLRALLQNVPDVEVVGEAADGLEALRLIEAHRPDVALMDIVMPGLNGLEATARASSQFPATRVLILSMSATKELVLQALQAGAAGYLPKNITPAELERGIKAVSRGQTYLASGVANHVIDACVAHVRETGGAFAALTHRQHEILQLIAEGHTTKAIAGRLGLSVKTVETYRAELMHALDIHDIAGLVRFAIRMGVISPDM